MAPPSRAGPSKLKPWLGEAAKQLEKLGGTMLGDLPAGPFTIQIIEFTGPPFETSIQEYPASYSFQKVNPYVWCVASDGQYSIPCAITRKTIQIFQEKNPGQKLSAMRYHLFYSTSPMLKISRPVLFDPKKSTRTEAHYAEHGLQMHLVLGESLGKQDMTGCLKHANAESSEIRANGTPIIPFRKSRDHRDWVEGCEGKYREGQKLMEQDPSFRGGKLDDEYRTWSVSLVDQSQGAPEPVLPDDYSRLAGKLDRGTTVPGFEDIKILLLGYAQSGKEPSLSDNHHLLRAHAPPPPPTKTHVAPTKIVPKVVVKPLGKLTVPAAVLGKRKHREETAKVTPEAEETLEISGWEVTPPRPVASTSTASSAPLPSPCLGGRRPAIAHSPPPPPVGTPSFSSSGFPAAQRPPTPSLTSTAEDISIDRPTPSIKTVPVLSQVPDQPPARQQSSPSPRLRRAKAVPLAKRAAKPSQRFALGVSQSDAEMHVDEIEDPTSSASVMPVDDDEAVFSAEPEKTSSGKTGESDASKSLPTPTSITNEDVPMSSSPAGRNNRLPSSSPPLKPVPSSDPPSLSPVKPPAPTRRTLEQLLQEKDSAIDDIALDDLRVGSSGISQPAHEEVEVPMQLEADPPIPTSTPAIIGNVPPPEPAPSHETAARTLLREPSTLGPATSTAAPTHSLPISSKSQRPRPPPSATARAPPTQKVATQGTQSSGTQRAKSSKMNGLSAYLAKKGFKGPKK